jgi:quinol monooxygenase YgiN
MRPSFVSLHPYFKAHPGKLDTIKAGFQRFVEKTASEEEMVFYGFTVNDNGDGEFFCREAYKNAKGVLRHLENVGPLLAEMLTMADLVRVELHGPGAELKKLKEPLAHLKPAWFVTAE